jgi:hypothetical protein
MTGIFILKKSYILSSLLAPLLIGTVLWSWHVHKSLKPLSEFVSLSSVFEVQRGEETADVFRLREGHPVTWSQSNLNRRRYAQNDDTLYVAPEDERTDYVWFHFFLFFSSLIISLSLSRQWLTGTTVCSSKANLYNVILVLMVFKSTGKRRYGHPALNGVLPEPWLPLKKGQSLVNNDRVGSPRLNKDSNQAVVLTLRQRYGVVRRGVRSLAVGMEGLGDIRDVGLRDPNTINPWEDTRPTSVHRPQTDPTLYRRLSFDHATGVIMLPDDGAWLAEDGDSDEEDGGMEDSQLEQSIISEPPSSSTDFLSPASPSRRRYGTYYHHPERRRQVVPGEFPRTPVN